MFRFNGDTNTSNGSSHSRRHSNRAQLAQASSQNSAALEELFMRDDCYYNMLYKDFDSNILANTSRHQHLSGNDHVNVGTQRMSSTSRNAAVANDAEEDEVIDHRKVRAELIRIQRAYEIIESDLARLDPDESLDDFDGPTSGIDLVEVTSAVRTPPLEQAQTAINDWNLNASSIAPPSANDSIQENHSGLSTSNAANAVDVATPATVNPIGSLVPERKPDEPSNNKTNMDLEQVEIPTNSEPYKCPVCLNCVRQRKPYTTMCGHVFCSSCIKTALRVTCKCPVCQKMMSTRQIFRIYI